MLEYNPTRALGRYLPLVEAQIYEVVRHHPGITPAALRDAVRVDPPESQTALHTHVARLNRLLAPFGVEIRSAGGGYSIRAVS